MPRTLKRILAFPCAAGLPRVDSPETFGNLLGGHGGAVLAGLHAQSIWKPRVFLADGITAF
eukprot:3732235-Pyramimonas_sp.AAC.1